MDIYLKALKAKSWQLFAVLLFIISPWAAAESEQPKITSFYIEKPLWSVGLGDADWLLPRTKKESGRFAFFSFSRKIEGDKSKAGVQQEDDSGRTSRSLPLYLAERMTVGSSCSAENHVFAVVGSGPVVAHQEWSVDDFSPVFNDSKPDYIVYGHILQDYMALRTTITVKVWSTIKNKQVFEVSESSLFDSPVNIAATLQKKFFKKLTQHTDCKIQESKYYPSPTGKLISPYLDGLGQLLSQTLVVNDVTDADSLWGEENMLNWYLSLWEHMPNSDAPKLMYVRGVITSVDYGGVAKKDFLPGLESYLQRSKDRIDAVTMLSPYIYKRVGNVAECKKAKARMLAIKDDLYQEWLARVECDESKKSGKD